MALTATWEPLHGDVDGTFPEHVYAFPRRRQQPLLDAVHVRNALQNFGAIEADDDEKKVAFHNLRRAAEHFHVEVDGHTYEEMCRRPQCEIHPRD